MCGLCHERHQRRACVLPQVLDPRIFGGGQGPAGPGEATSGAGGAGAGGAGGGFGGGTSTSAGHWPPAGTQLRSEIQMQRGSVPAGAMVGPGVGGMMGGSGGAGANGAGTGAGPGVGAGGGGPGWPGGPGGPPPPPAVVRPAQSVSSLTSGVARLSVGQQRPGPGVGTSYGGT